MVELLIPDAWQQLAVEGLRAGEDVIVDAPTSAGKTFIFEAYVEHGLRSDQAIYTVPTRALANDKFAAWRARGWNPGIITGDITFNPTARVVVATLETLREDLLARRGPRLLVLDEYQMLADEQRGAMYELALALAPPSTQLLLLSGSVANPAAIEQWLARLGRRTRLVRTAVRPVPLDEVALDALRSPLPAHVTGFWPQMLARAISAGLAPVLVFAPRRRAAEKIATDLAASLPLTDPLSLSREQGQLVGDRLASLLKRRVAYHHSGLSYIARAGVIEPLARAGQLRVVVATTGLAAGINFSLRSVLVTDTNYQAGKFQRSVEPHELLQMFGRAGRRGIDERGYALYTERTPRLSEARPIHLRRVARVDWPVCLSVMRAAVQRRQEPFAASVDLMRRLFTAQPVTLGVEHSLEDGPRACGLLVDLERARHSRALHVEMQNLAGEWEALPTPTTAKLGETWLRLGSRWRPALSLAESLHGIGRGNLARLPVASNLRSRVYGREIHLGNMDSEKGFRAGPAVRRIISAQRGGQPIPKFWKSAAELVDANASTLEAYVGGRLIRTESRGTAVFAQFDFSGAAAARPGYLSRDGRFLIDPPRREIRNAECLTCPSLAACTNMTGATSAALAWRDLGLVDAGGVPTRRGVIASFFQNGEGLAIAAALEDESYPIPEIVRDLADIRAGHRFSQDGSPFQGRLAAACVRAFGNASYEGVLELGLPPQFGGGAGVVLAEILARPATRQKYLSDELCPGDIERALLEWQSLLRRVASAPDTDWDRWMSLKQAASGQSEIAPRSHALTFPPLTGAQMRRIEHRLR